MGKFTLNIGPQSFVCTNYFFLNGSENKKVVLYSSRRTVVYLHIQIDILNFWIM